MIRLAAAVCLLFVTEAWAQTGAMIVVRLSGEDGTRLSAAVVTLWPSILAAKTDAQGVAAFDELTAGEYRVEAVADAYAPRDTLVSLTPGERLDLALVLDKVAVTLPDVIVETSKQATDVRNFGRKEILSSGARTLPDFLSLTAGLDVRTDGTAGSVRTVRIGGSNANQVLVLLDGRQLRDVGSGESDLSAIPLDWVESVEISRGGKTEYGGEAIGGILRITTLRPGQRGELSAAAQVYPTYTRASFLRSAKTGQFFCLLSYCRTQGPGNFKYVIDEDDGNGPFTINLGKIFRRLNADIARDQLLVKVGSASSNDDRLEASGSMDRAARGMPGYLAPRLTLQARQNTSQEALNVRAMHALGKFDTEARASYQHDWREFKDPDVYSLVHYSSESSGEWEGELRGRGSIERTTLSGGVCSAREALTSEQIAGGKATRVRWSTWVEAGEPFWSVENHDLVLTGNAGIRWEKYGGGQVVLPKASLMLGQTSVIHGAVTVSWGKSYRAPDFYSLFWLDDEMAEGNPNLRPEVSSEWTGHASTEAPGVRGLHIEADVSDQTVSDLIFWRQTFDNRWKPFNLSRAHLRTLDLGVEQSVWRDRIRLAAGVNWTEARNATDDRNTGGKYLTFRAPRSYRANVVVRDHSLEMNVNYRWGSARPILETNSKWLHAYELVDARLSCQFRAGEVRFEPSFGVNNLFNENYRLVRFAPMPGRELFAAIRVTHE